MKFSILKKTTNVVIVSGMLIASFQELDAAQGNVPFVGDVTNRAWCWIWVNQNGKLAPSANSRQLSSKLPGGQAGLATISAFSNYTVSVTTPFYFDSRPLGGDDNVSFSSFYSASSVSGTWFGSRGLSFPERPGELSARLPYGYSATRITVNLVADRTDAFPAGNYSAHTVVRCE